MNKIINIRSSKAISEIKRFKKKKISLIDIKFENAHLKEINKLVGFTIFSKNDLFINSTTLWEIMQPAGLSGSHHYHEISPEDVCETIASLNEPIAIIKAKSSRFAILPSHISNYNEPLLVIIEIGAPLINNANASINKIVTIYPKKDLDKFLKKLEENEILYKK